MRRSLPLAVLMNQIKFWKLTGECASLLAHAKANARHLNPLEYCTMHPKADAAIVGLAGKRNDARGWCGPTAPRKRPPSAPKGPP